MAKTRGSVFLLLTAALTQIAFAGVNRWTHIGPDGGPVRALLLHPEQPSVAVAAVFGLGIVKSENGGTDWTLKNTGLTDPDVLTLARAPSNPELLYAGTQSGLYRSADGGQTWAFVGISEFCREVRTVAMAPSDSDRIYVGTNVGVYSSEDARETWAWRSGDWESRGSLTTAGLAVDPQDSDTVYAFTLSGEAFKSTDGGVSWQRLSDPFGLRLRIRELIVDPDSPSNLYGAGTLGFYKSADGGETWAIVEVGPELTLANALAWRPSQPGTFYLGGKRGIHISQDGGDSWHETGYSQTRGEVQALAFDPMAPATIWAGSGVGVSKSTDGGDAWQDLDGFEGNIVTGLALHPTDSRILYAAAFSSGIYATSDGGANWVPESEGIEDLDILTVALSAADPQTLYTGNWSRGGYRSRDGGISWTRIIGEEHIQFDTFVNAIGVRPDDPDTVYFGFLESSIVKSTDGGENWLEFRLPGPPFSYGEINGFEFDKSDPDNFYVVAEDGILRYEPDSLPSTLFLPGFGPIRDMAIDPADPSRLVAIRGPRVYLSTNRGEDWEQILESYNYLQSVAIAPLDPPVIYVSGLADGVYRSLDGGASWSSINKGLPTLEVYTLEVSPVDPSKVFAGTRGRGVFEFTNDARSRPSRPPAIRQRPPGF